MRFISPAVSGITTERKASISSRKLSPTTTAIVRISRLGDLVGEVDVAGRRSADVRGHVRALGRRRDRVVAQAPDELLGGPVGGRSRRRHVQDRGGPRRVDERFSDLLHAAGVLEIVAQVRQARDPSPSDRASCAGRRPCARCPWSACRALAGPAPGPGTAPEPAARPCASSCAAICCSCLSAFCLAWLFWSDSCLLTSSILAWSGLAGCLDMSTLTSSGPFVPGAEGRRQPVVRLPRIGALRERAVVLLAEVEVERGSASATEHGDARPARTAAGAARRSAPTAPSRAAGRRAAVRRCGSASRSIRSPTMAEERGQQRDATAAATIATTSADV